MTTLTRTCHFPGCERPVEPPTSGRGRNPAYCDDDDHTALTAYRARRSGAGAAAALEDAGRPVSMATVRAGSLRDDLVKIAGQLAVSLERMTGELTTLADPDAAAAEVETVATEATERVAAAEAARSRAKVAERDATAKRVEANAERVEAVAAAEDLEHELAGVKAAHADTILALEAALADVAEAATVNEALVADLTRVTGERETLTTRAEDLDRQLSGERVQAADAATTVARLQAQLEAVTARADDVTARANTAETARTQADQARHAAETATARLEAQLEQAQLRVGELTGERTELAADLLAATERAGRAETRNEARAALESPVPSKGEDR